MLPQRNATLVTVERRIGVSGGFRENYDQEATDGVEWTGSVDAYYLESTSKQEGRERDVLVTRTLIVNARDLPFVVHADDRIYFTRDEPLPEEIDAEVIGVVLTVEQHHLAGAPNYMRLGFRAE